MSQHESTAVLLLTTSNLSSPAVCDCGEAVCVVLLCFCTQKPRLSPSVTPWFHCITTWSSGCSEHHPHYIIKEDFGEKGTINVQFLRQKVQFLPRKQRKRNRAAWLLGASLLNVLKDNDVYSDSTEGDSLIWLKALTSYLMEPVLRLFLSIRMSPASIHQSLQSDFLVFMTCHTYSRVALTFRKVFPMIGLQASLLTLHTSY